MSAPGGVTATTTTTGGSGSYAISYSWTAATTPAAQSYTVTLNSIIWGVTSAVVGPTNYTSPPAAGSYTNTVTGASYQLVVIAYAGTSQTGASSTFTSTQASVYNPYGGPQGVQGYQGVQGGQGATGPTGLQGSRGLQGLMEINNYTVANQITTTAADTAHLTANSGLTWIGTTLNIGGNITGVTSINNTTIGGVTVTSGALTGVTNISNAATTAITSIGTLSYPVTTLYAAGLCNVTSISNTGSAGITSIGTSGFPVTTLYAAGLCNVTTISNTGSAGITSIGTNTFPVGTLYAAAISNVTSIAGAAAAITSIGTSALPVTTIYAAAISNGASGTLTVGTSVTSGDFIATSDRRLKTDISTISNALDTVKAMRGVYFTRLGKTQRTVGVIAQEVEEVLPEVVYTGDDEMKSVSYGNMVGLLIEAVKELSEKMKV